MLHLLNVNSLILMFSDKHNDFMFNKAQFIASVYVVLL